MKKIIFPAVAFIGCLFFSSMTTAQEAVDSSTEQETIILKKKKGSFPEDFTLHIQGDQITINGKPPRGLTIIRQKSSADDNRRLQFRRGGAFGNTFPAPDPFAFSNGNSQALLGVISPRNDSAEGARIAEVEAGTPADSAGLQKGDLITQVGDRPISNSADLRAAIRQHDPGDQVEVTYIRQGSMHQLNVTLGRLDNRHGMQAFGPSFPGDNFSEQWFRRFHPRINRDPNLRMSSGPKLGVTVEDHQDPQGVIVRQVSPGTAASTAGLQAGDVITAFGDKPIADVTDLRAAIKAQQGRQDIEVNIQRDGNPQTLQVSLAASKHRASL